MPSRTKSRPPKRPVRAAKAAPTSARKRVARPAAAPAPAAKSAPIPVGSPGGYPVFDAASLTGAGRSAEVGRVVHAEGGFEAWNRVDGGYVRVGRFAASEQAIMALGDRARRRAAAAPTKPSGGAEIIALRGRRTRR
jgi:hypothetical protein